VVHYGTGPLDVATAPVLTKAAHDKGVRIPLGGLLPETRYSYAVEINHVLDPRVFSFATFPSAGQERSFTVVAFADHWGRALPFA
jgi:phosphodiesterase/alkaline phosphatase D-like protein